MVVLATRDITGCMYRDSSRCNKNRGKSGNNRVGARIGLAGAGWGVVRGRGGVLGVFL